MKMLFPQWLAVTLFFPVLADAAALPKLTRGDELIAEYFRAETTKLTDNCLTGINTLGSWTAQREQSRRELFEMLSLSPVPPRGDLKAVVTGRVEHDAFTVENLHFQSVPGLYVTANLYMPKNISEPVPTILYLSGHGAVIKNGISYGNKVAYQHHGSWFARNGYACLILDTVQLGEIEGIHHGTYREGMWWWNARGYSSAGIEAWNCIRALDYLSTRAEVDTNRFGVTGRSGGGAYSWWVAALDERIKVAAPVAGITDLQNHVVDGVVEGHCDCMFMVNTHRWDYPQVAALVAPRPLLIANTDKDSIFPLDGVMRLHAKVRNVYQLYGAATNLGLLITEGPHKDTQDLQVPVFRWFNRHLKGEDPIIEMAAVKLFEPGQLKVFNTLPADAINANIHATFVAPAAPPAVPSSAHGWKAQRDGWLSTLRKKTFGAWPTDAAPPKLEPKFSVTRHDLQFQVFEFTSESHVPLRLYLVHRAGLAAPERVVLTALDGSSTGAISPYNEWLETMRQGFPTELIEEMAASPDSPSPSAIAGGEKAFARLRGQLQTNKLALAYVAPRGIGLTAWNQTERKQTQIRRRFMLLGRTLDSMRVWDIRRAVQALRSANGLQSSPLWLQARGETAVNVLYASLFESGIERLDLHRLPASHHAGPDYLNVLRTLDLPQAVALAAERCPVRLHETESVGWEFPASVAKNLGWDEKRLLIEPAGLQHPK